INTSETLQSRAKTVGTATIREVSAGVAIESITGYTNENKTRVEYLALTVRPRAGSKDIGLSLCTLSTLFDNLSILTLDESNIQNVNVDNKSVFNTPVAPGSSYTILDNTTSITFGVIAIHDPDSSVTGTSGMNSGDRIIIIVNLSAIIPSQGGLLPRQSISGTLTPEIGIKAQYDTTAPAVFSKRVINLS
ncbi:unnamed protein product, partial [marine sediment metagenome]